MPFGLFPQALLVDAKASTENNRDTLQQSQLPMDAEFVDASGRPYKMTAGVIPHLVITANDAKLLYAISTSIFVHFYYKNVGATPPFRNLKSIFVLSIPHATLKVRYNPDPKTSFFGQGKHSPSRGEVARIRVYFSRLRQMCPWRLQELSYSPGSEYTKAEWRDTNASGQETMTGFDFIGR